MAKDDKKPKYEKITSPIGVFKYPKLNEPDFGNKEYPKPEGQHSVKLILKAADKETKAWLKKLEPHYQAALAAGKEEFKTLKAETRKKLKKVTENPLYTELLDQETEEPTGEIEFNIKMDASGTVKKGPRAGKKWTAKPLIFDSKGIRMHNPPDIWGGTRGRISMELRPYFIPGSGAAGLKLKLVGAKIIDLISAGERSADSVGLGGEEDGYGYEEPAEEAGAKGGDDAADGDGDF
jgi:hypothetical protein